MCPMKPAARLLPRAALQNPGLDWLLLLETSASSRWDLTAARLPAEFFL